MLAHELRNPLAPISAAVEQARPLLARHHELMLGEGPGLATVQGDRKRLVQVLANLLNNAAKYTPPWGRITLHVAREAGCVTITVADNGVGMDAALARRAFELFAQGERNADRTQGGLGIGLALVKHLVELHCGSVTAKSDGLGRGSAFAITLPASGGDPEAVTGAAQGMMARLEGGSSRLRILLVDDNTDAAAMLALIVEAAGHAVTVAHTAQAALHLAGKEAFDACLLDIGLPDMGLPDINGYELAQRLRALPGMQHAMLVAVTGYGQPSDREASQQAGFDHHFVKPVDSTRLLDLLAARESEPRGWQVPVAS